MAVSVSDRKIIGLLPEAALPGALLVASAVIAMAVVNSPLGHTYQSVLAFSFSIGPTGGGIEMKVSDWFV